MAASPDGKSVAAVLASSGENSASRSQAVAEPSQPSQPPHNLEAEPDTQLPQSPSLESSAKDDRQPTTSPAAPSTLPFGIEMAQSQTSLPHEESILAVFGDALRSTKDDSDIEHVSPAAAITLNMLCPPIDDKNDKSNKNNPAVVTVEAFLWSLWTLLLGIVRVVPHNTEHPGQATLVSILDALRQLPRGTVSVWGNSDMQLWRDLPLFVPRFTESNARPRGNNIPDKAVRHWRNQSAFAARCLQAGLATWYDEAVYALRDALEGDGGDNGGIPTSPQRCSILAATEWAIHSGKALLKQTQENDEDYEDYEDIDGGSTAYERDDDVPPGPVFREKEPDARAGLSGARWEFWKEQFQDLLQTAPDHDLHEDVRAAVQSAVECMERAEKESAEQEAEQLRNWEMEMDEQEKECGDGESKGNVTVE